MKRTKRVVPVVLMATVAGALASAAMAVPARAGTVAAPPARTEPA